MTSDCLLYISIYVIAESVTPHNLSLDDQPPPPPPPPPGGSDKPIVSYIKLQPDIADGRGGRSKGQQQKVSSDHSDGGYSDLDGQTTLKVCVKGLCFS